MRGHPGPHSALPDAPKESAVPWDPRPNARERVLSVAISQNRTVQSPLADTKVRLFSKNRRPQIVIVWPRRVRRWR